MELLARRIETGPPEAVRPPLRAGSAAPADAIVAFEGVRKSYDGRHLVVADLALRIRRGEFLTLLGPSCSGKTTTLMMLAGFEQPTSGRILLDGAPIERLPPERRNIGVVFQNYALFPHMSVAENIAFPLRYRGIKGAAAKARAEEALAMVRLASLGDRKPAQLSGGQQQRVALARALVFGPRLVLMDEPLGALDKQLRESMQVEIKHLQRSLGITVVFVTHDQGEALTMSDRVAVFHDGRIQQLDDPVSLYERPANRFVAGFIGENNLIPCTVERQGAEVVAVARDGTRLALAEPPAATGPATLVVRPERLRLVAPGQAVIGLDNRFAATIQESFFQGDHALVRARGLGAEELSVKVPAGMAGEHGLAPGTAVTLAVRAADCRVLTE
jgi:putative spermidine/putrescine transport system ATP-binding protein